MRSQFLSCIFTARASRSRHLYKKTQLEMTPLVMRKKITLCNSKWKEEKVVREIPRFAIQGPEVMSLIERRDLMNHGLIRVVDTLLGKSILHVALQQTRKWPSVLCRLVEFSYPPRTITKKPGSCWRELPPFRSHCVTRAWQSLLWCREE